MDSIYTGHAIHNARERVSMWSRLDLDIKAESLQNNTITIHRYIILFNLEIVEFVHLDAKLIVMVTRELLLDIKGFEEYSYWFIDSNGTQPVIR